MLRLILKENSLHFNGKNYLQTHGTAMGTKMAVSFANIFMAAVETEIINRSHLKPLTWKRYIDDVFSLWNINKEEINSFIELANSYHPTIKFTAEISDQEISFLDTCVYKGERFKKESDRKEKITSLDSTRLYSRYLDFPFEFTTDFRPTFLLRFFLPSRLQQHVRRKILDQISIKHRVLIR